MESIGDHCNNNLKRRHNKYEDVCILLLAVGAIIVSFLLQPSQRGLELWLPILNLSVNLPDVCISRRILGLVCPGCGLTHSFAAMARGELQLAFSMNPMGPVVFLICCLQIPYRLAVVYGLGKWNAFLEKLDKGIYVVIWAVIIGFIIVGIIRLLEAFFSLGVVL